MTIEKRVWVVEVAAAAVDDFRDIIAWTERHFGPSQARVYARSIDLALAELSGGPALVGVKPRDDAQRGLKTLHIARHGRKGRHFVLFRVASRSDHDVIEVLRVLHDSMDLIRHLVSLGSESGDP